MRTYEEGGRWETSQGKEACYDPNPLPVTLTLYKQEFVVGLHFLKPVLASYAVARADPKDEEKSSVVTTKVQRDPLRLEIDALLTTDSSSVATRSTDTVVVVY